MSLVRRISVLTMVTLVATGSGCRDDDAGLPDCVDLSFEVDECAPLYQPTFDNVYENTLAESCSYPEANSCHGHDAASGARPHGLVFSDADTAHEALMGESEGRPFVDTDDASCSLLVVRVTVDDTDYRMPPGESPLDEKVRCAIAKWIEAGAER